MSNRRTIVRSSAIMGSSSLVGIFLGIVRMRIAAMFVGPIGIGLLGLLQNIVMLGGSVASLGIGAGGARELARVVAAEDKAAIANARRSMWVAGFALAAVGSIASWLVFRFAPDGVIDSPAIRNHAGWLAIAVGLSVIGTVQIGVLTGYRRIGDIARVNIVAGLITTIIAAIAFPWLGEQAILIVVFATPLFAALVGLVATRGLPTSDAEGRFRSALCTPMVILGLGMTVSSIASLVSGLAIRGIVLDRLGEFQLGLFQAAWTIASMYLGLVMNAMATDYLPRLSTHLGDNDVLTKLIDEQIEVLVVVGGPLILIVTTLAPIALVLLYGREFLPADDFLRLLLIGDFIKLVSWPMGFSLIALGATRTYASVEITSAAIFVLVSWVSVDSLGLAGVAAGYVVMLVFFLFSTIVALRRRKILRIMSAKTMKELILLAAAAALLVIALLHGGSLLLGFSLAVSVALTLRASHYVRKIVRLPVEPGLVKSNSENAQ